MKPSTTPEKQTADPSPRNDNPAGETDKPRYDLVVIGGGAAGLTAAGVATHFGAKTLLVERGRFGGDCTWHGCVPSKALLKSAHVAYQVKQSGRYGIEASLDAVNFESVMSRVRRLREEIYEEDDHPRHFEAIGIDVRHGHARFLDERTIELENDTDTWRVEGRKIIIATGGRALIPPIEGLEDVPYLTNETLFELEEQPGRLGIIGAGSIGVEMAQAFTRLGTKVIVLETESRILPNDDEELSTLLREVLEQEGVEFRFGSEVTRASIGEDGSIRLESGRAKSLEVDALLIAAGQRPSVEGLGLEAAGVEYTDSGISINAYCRTSQKHIYAVGDVTGRYEFTHMSEHMAKVAATNAILKLPQKIDVKNVPWVTFTDPELAQVGKTEAELRKEGASFKTYRFPYSMLDRAVIDGQAQGLIKVHARSWSGKILGASILGARAGELISEYAVAMRNGVTLRKLADTIHPYPSYGLGARRAADQWYVQKQAPRLVRLLQRVFGYRGPVIEPDPDRIV